MTEPTTPQSVRIIAGKLKGVRGLGGAEGITKMLREMAEMGLVSFVNDNREVILQNENTVVQLLKKLCSICDLESLNQMVGPLSKRGVLYGDRAHGDDHTESTYDLFVVADEVEEVTKIVTSHPLGKKIDLTVWPAEDFAQIKRKNSKLAERVSEGIVMWASSW
tara:strand:- start:751 stop:1242 length:492 start_codon:yes stop_codon:yes gene_type:complete